MVKSKIGEAKYLSSIHQEAAFSQFLSILCLSIFTPIFLVELTDMQKKKNLEKCFHYNLEGFQLTGIFFKLLFEFLAVFKFGCFYNNLWKVL